MLTYKQAYDKLITAYFKDEIKPFDPKFCFCGTLNDNNPLWFRLTAELPNSHDDGLHYNGSELFRMEDALLTHLHLSMNTHEKFSIMTNDFTESIDDLDGYEDELFIGFCKALEVLKQIHIERGEIVEDMPKLEKRVLC